MCSRFKRHRMTEPSVQTTSIGVSVLPHCWVRLATAAGARNSMAEMPKLDGFHRCRPFTRSTYLERIERIAHRANGQASGDRIRMPQLIPDT